MIRLRRKARASKAPCRKGGVPCKDAPAQAGIAVFGSGGGKTWDETPTEAKEKGDVWGG